MMKESFGKRLAGLRKSRKWTQEDVAAKLNLSAQAVSKWENDSSMPDLEMLVALAEIYQTTTDELLGKVPASVVTVSPENKRDLNKLVFRINIRSTDGDKVKVNLPFPLVMIALETGFTPKVDGRDVLKDIDFKKIIEMVEQGIIGIIVEIESKEGDIVEIVVE
jgi:transcriptional regulator with XRE-family HTH domain